MLFLHRSCRVRWLQVPVCSWGGGGARRAMSESIPVVFSAEGFDGLSVVLPAFGRRSVGTHAQQPLICAGLSAALPFSRCRLVLRMGCGSEEPDSPRWEGIET